MNLHLLIKLIHNYTLEDIRIIDVMSIDEIIEQFNPDITSLSYWVPIEKAGRKKFYAHDSSTFKQ